MHGNNHKSITNFYVVGLNYRKTDAAIRGQFAVSNQQYLSILSLASLQHLNELFILSTCNRTEIYGFAAHPDQLIGLICSGTNGNADVFPPGHGLIGGIWRFEYRAGSRA